MSVEVVATRRAQRQIAALDRTHERAFAAFLDDLSLNGCAALAYRLTGPVPKNTAPPLGAPRKRPSGGHREQSGSLPIMGSRPGVMAILGYAQIGLFWLWRVSFARRVKGFEAGLRAVGE